MKSAALIRPDSSAASPSGSLESWIDNLRSADDKARWVAWQSAPQFGAPAIRSIGELLNLADAETARAASRALFAIARHAGRPGAGPEQEAVSAELVTLLQGPNPIRRQVLWMLSEIGDHRSVPAIADLLAEREVREDARAALERIPGLEAVAALRAALETAPETYRPALAQSLRVRGAKVTGYPSEKLLPSRPPS
jgi:HEAT repeat protein